MNRRLLLSVVVSLAACYSGGRAARDVNEAWRGRRRANLEARWGKPAAVTERPGGTVLLWSHERRHIRLPSASGSLSVEPGRMDLEAVLRPGEVWNTRTEVAALVDPAGVVAQVEGPSLRWGPPDDANLRWGTVLGLHVGMGRLDDTRTPLPSGGLYIGGMLARTLGLVGTFSMVSGHDEAGGALGFAWGIAPQWWPTTRVWLRAGPAMVLAFNPGFEDARLAPGLSGGASYALVKAGTFVLDLRLDLTAATTGAFGSAGIGVNLN